MAEVKISDFNRAKAVTDITKFLEAIGNAIMSAIQQGDIRYEEVPLKCEKCGANATEYRLVFTVKFRHYIWLFFNLQRDIVMKVFWHTECGLSYCRFESK